MKGEELLRTAGLNKYEASAYNSLICKGTMTAKELSRVANVPMGKIYEVLSSLEDEGFLEVQRGRPIIYKPVKPSLAFDRFYGKRKEEKEGELQTLKESIALINNHFPKLNDPIGKDRVFISTVMGKDEITRGYTEAFREAESDIYVINSARMKEIERWPYHDTVAPLIDSLFEELKRGIRVNCIDPGTGLKEIFEERADSIPDEDQRYFVRNNIRIKIKESDHDFVLVDDTLSIVDVADPLVDRMMAIMKIYDASFNGRLKKHFEKVWEED